MATTFTNQAILTYNNTVRPSNVVTGVINDVLSATKLAIPDEYTTGDVITYVVSLVNTSASMLNDLTISDNLGAYSFGMTTLYPLEYIEDSVVWIRDGIPQTVPLDVDSTGDDIVIQGVDVSPRGLGTGITQVIYQVRVNEFAPVGTAPELNITNTVSITGTPLTTPVTASATITQSDALNLDIFKSVSPNPVPENGQLTYTLLIRNYGNRASVATDNVVVSDTFDPYLADIVVTLNGAVLPPTAYSYSSTGLFITDPGVITVPAATFTQNPVTGAYTVVPGTATLTISGTISSPPTP